MDNGTLRIVYKMEKPKNLYGPELIMGGMFGDGAGQRGIKGRKNGTTVIA